MSVWMMNQLQLMNPSWVHLDVESGVAGLSAAILAEKPRTSLAGYS